MKKVLLVIAVLGLVFTSCKKETIEPIQPTPAVANPAEPAEPADTTTVVDTTTVAIDYANDNTNDGTYLAPQFALKICGATSGQNVSSIVDSIVFTNYTKNYIKVKTALDITNDPLLHWGNVSSPSDGSGIGYSIPEAIVESGDSCNVSVYMSADQGQYGYSEYGFTTVSLITEYGTMITPTHYSHSDNF